MSALLCLPFVGVVLSIAFFPLISPKVWHQHQGKISLVWLTAGILAVVHFYSLEKAIHDVSHTLLLEYLPFVSIVLALYTISGGVRLHIHAKPTPLLNTAVLAIGSLFSNIVGTTGASMILIRPFLKLNHHRKYRTHQVVFFIFAISNIGGLLTPLGDPPLFMGFLKGIDFFWTVKILWSPYIVILLVLLSLFYIVDRSLCEVEYQGRQDSTTQINIDGKMHLLLLGGVVGLVLQSGLWKPEVYFNIFGTDVPLQNIVRDVGMLAMAGLSLLMTPMSIRKGHEFHWGPFLEVAKLFLAIFITLVPIVELIKNLGGQIKDVLTPSLYFWISGFLSSFLDNAPTYLIFFNLAGGDPIELMTSKAHILEAISLGAVCMGAMTYIGNAPNFMVASIARNYQIRMPSFFGYIGWSIAILLPILFLVDFIFLP